MKKIFIIPSLLATATLSCTGLISCKSKNKSEVEGVKIVDFADRDARLTVHGERVFQAVVEPDTISQDVYWSIKSGRDIVSIDQTSGRVTALKEGTAVIKATSVLDENAFATCMINVSDNNWYTFGTYTDGGSVSGLISGFSGDDQKLKLPEKCKIDGQELPITRIGDTTVGNAFNNNKNLTEVTFPNSIKYVGGRAFSHCTSLMQVNFNEGLLTIGEWQGLANEGAFFGAAMEHVKIPNSVTSIGNQAFAKTNLKDIDFNINSSLQEIKGNAFYNCQSLANIVLPDKLAKIDRYAFENCKSIMSITMPKSLNEIRDAAFAFNIKLSEIDLSDWGNADLPTSWTPYNESDRYRIFHNCGDVGTIYLKTGCEKTDQWKELLSKQGIVFKDTEHLEGWEIEYKD